MRLKCHIRRKDGKEHRYWSIVESVRCSRERVVQRHVLYLGELNDSQREGWTRCLGEIDGRGHTEELALFPADRPRTGLRDAGAAGDDAAGTPAHALTSGGAPYLCNP